MATNELKAKIFRCGCGECRALTGLMEEAGAKLIISPSTGGRFCEFAVVAAAGTQGIAPEEVVRKRRQYAEHLGIELAGNTQNNDGPGHIRWAIKYSNHNTQVKEPNGRINLGRAHASEKDGKLFLTWSAEKRDGFVNVPLYIERDGSRTLFLPTLATRNGYVIGPKGEEHVIRDYWDALDALNTMGTPRFRRANNAGNRGIVACAPGHVEDVKVSYIERLLKQVPHD
jgi:hypothetical protein